MRTETIALLNMADSIIGYGRDVFIADIKSLYPAKDFFTADELAERYGVSRQTIQNWEADGRLVPDLRIGKGCVRYSAAVVAAFEKKSAGQRKQRAG
jgi:DNA-binding XRE family transcriptional regulator